LCRADQRLLFTTTLSTIVTSPYEHVHRRLLPRRRDIRHFML
jgi:hypothetical protein